LAFWIVEFPFDCGRAELHPGQNFQSASTDLPQSLQNGMKIRIHLIISL